MKLKDNNVELGLLGALKAITHFSSPSVLFCKSYPTVCGTALCFFFQLFC